MAKTLGKVGIWNRALARIGETAFIQAEDDESPEAEVCRLNYDDWVEETLRTAPWPFAIKQAALTQATGSVTYDGNGQTEFSVPWVFADNDDVTITIGGVASTAFAATGEGGLHGKVTTDSAVGVGTSIVITSPLTRVGWLYGYALPQDCVTPLALLNEGERIGLFTGGTRHPFDIQLDHSGEWQLLLCDLEADEDFQVLEYVALVTRVAAFPRDFVDAIVWALASELALSIKKDPKLAGEMLNAYARTVAEARARAFNGRQEDPEPTTPSIAARE